MTRDELKAAAVAMLDRAYIPYSHFPVVHNYLISLQNWSLKGNQVLPWLQALCSIYVAHLSPRTATPHEGQQKILCHELKNEVLSM